MIEGRIAKGEDVIVMAHSYGGMPTSEAVQGLPPKLGDGDVGEQDRNKWSSAVESDIDSIKDCRTKNIDRES